MSWLQRALAPGVVVLLASGCVLEDRRFDVELQVRVAEDVDVDVEGGDPGVRLNASYVDDQGNSNGVDLDDAGAIEVTSTDFARVRFELIALEKASVSVLGLGRSGFFDVPADGEPLVVPVLLAPPNFVGSVEANPPSLGDGSCVTADERGRAFLVGGVDARQSGYVFGDNLTADALDDVDSFDGVSGAGCSAGGGVVVAVGGCDGDVDGAIHVLSATGSRRVPVPELGPDLCGGFATATGDGFFFVSRIGNVVLLDVAGAVVASAGIGSAGVSNAGPIARVETVGDRAVIEYVDDRAVLLVESDGVSVDLTVVGTANHIGRRFADVVALEGRSLFLLEGRQLVLVRDDDVVLGAGAADVSSFTVLSDNTVVAIVGNELRISKPGAVTIVRPLPRARRQVSALPGDTLILSGGSAGIDAIALP